MKPAIRAMITAVNAALLDMCFCVMAIESSICTIWKFQKCEMHGSMMQPRIGKNGVIFVIHFVLDAVAVRLQRLFF